MKYVQSRASLNVWLGCIGFMLDLERGLPEISAAEHRWSIYADCKGIPAADSSYRLSTHKVRVPSLLHDCV